MMPISRALWQFLHLAILMLLQTLSRAPKLLALLSAMIISWQLHSSAEALLRRSLSTAEGAASDPKSSHISGITMMWFSV